MARTIIFFFIIYSTSTQLIFLSEAKGNSTFPSNENIQKLLQKSNHTRHSLYDIMPMTLNIEFRYRTGQVVFLNWRKSRQFLANEHLPVIPPLIDSKSGISNKSGNIMKDVGNFVAYYDFKKLSAVLYFEKRNSFFGVINRTYYIQDLPYNFDQSGHYQESADKLDLYLFERANKSSQSHLNMGLPPSSKITTWKTHDLFHRNLKRISVSNVGSSFKYRHIKQKSDVIRQEINKIVDLNHYMSKKSYDQDYYLEILVLVTQDIIKTSKRHFKDDYILWTVAYYLVYFNSINMFLQKSKSDIGEININIAKIVFEDDSRQFGFNYVDKLQYNEIISKLPQFLNASNSEYPPDSFDYVFLFTRNQIMNRSSSIIRFTTNTRNLCESRKNNTNFYDVVPITVMGLKSSHSDYFHEAKKIRKTFGIKVGVPKTNTLTDDFGYQDSRENRNNCVLLNRPRSLLPPGKSKLLVPQKQCKWFGLDYHWYNNRDPNAMKIVCDAPLKCHNASSSTMILELTVIPFDGTSCGPRKVCWDKVCQKETT